jgi:hypothetical protein
MNMVRNGNARIMAVIGFNPIVGATPCGCPKSWAGTGACPYKGYVPMNMVRNGNARIMAVIGFNPIVGATPCGCPKSWAGTLNVPTFKRSNVPTFIQGLPLQGFFQYWHARSGVRVLTSAGD